MERKKQRSEILNGISKYLNSRISKNKGLGADGSIHPLLQTTPDRTSNLTNPSKLSTTFVQDYIMDGEVVDINSISITEEWDKVNIRCSNGLIISIHNIIGGFPAIDDRIYYDANHSVYVYNNSGQAVDIGIVVGEDYTHYHNFGLNNQSQIMQYSDDYNSNVLINDSEVSINYITEDVDSNVIVNNVEASMEYNANNIFVDDSNIGMSFNDKKIVSLNDDAIIDTSNLIVAPTGFNAIANGVELADLIDGIATALQNILTLMTAGLTSPAGPVTVVEPLQGTNLTTEIIAIMTNYYAFFNKPVPPPPPPPDNP